MNYHFLSNVNIAIIGLRGTGKTTISILLAKALDKKLISTDGEIEKKAKMSIAKFVKKHGWDKFREIESDVIEEICELDECVFDTGGGAVLRNENLVNLKKNALIILLTAGLKIMAKRIKKSRERPALTNLGTILEIRKIMKERDEKYKKAADYTIDTSKLSPKEVCDLITYYIQGEVQK